MLPVNDVLLDYGVTVQQDKNNPENEDTRIKIYKYTRLNTIQT